METVKTEAIEDFIIVDPKTEVEDDFDNNDDNSNEVPAEFVDFPETVEVSARTDGVGPGFDDSDLVIVRHDGVAARPDALITKPDGEESETPKVLGLFYQKMQNLFLNNHNFT